MPRASTLVRESVASGWIWNAQHRFDGVSVEHFAKSSESTGLLASLNARAKPGHDELGLDDGVETSWIRTET
jgi:hypothetical protein